MRQRVVLITVVVVLLAGGAWWIFRDRGRDIPTTPPAGAPAVGSCWSVDAAGAQAAFPWAGGTVDCSAGHTVEVFHVDQVSEDLLHRHDKARGEEVKLTENLLYAQARRACLVQGPIFLGGGWHENRVQIVASWIKPASDGFFACAVAEVSGPTADEYLARKITLKGALKGADLAIACVKRSGEQLRYVGCAEAHDGEYSGVYTITPPEAPFDETAVRSASAKGCTTLGLHYLGLPEDGTREDLAPGSVGPKTASEWLGSDQAFTCYLMSGKPLKATVKGLGLAPLPTL
ncbi:septum formation family protein [Dactylosporangium sp. AC04546]|uniref:septum formation family protein n=1 Tax=Dactylosporangium sp. AC04546 TaxID=2862460 RepID=UPI001EDE3084|nr:septum formation family protein [Dactylosporangium sp. AC04546]WVK84106.1 septum formation family protein [Dactylosporangium sp. AC04546]